MVKHSASKSNKSNRNVGLDLLRCVAMIMVVGLHFLGKGNLLPDMAKADSWTGIGIVAWAIEAVCIVAVNVYMLISGYLLSKSSFKLSRLIELYLQLWVYSVGGGLVAYATGLVPAEEFNTYYLLRLALPVSMEHYWFMTAYVFFYLLLPLLGLAVRNMNKKQHGVAVIILLAVHCVLKSVLPFKLEVDRQGYDFLWYSVMFLVAAYIRKYEPKWMSRRSSIIMMLVGMAGSFAELMAIGKVGLMTGKLEHVALVSMHYNHIFPLLGALGMFGLAVSRMDKPEKKTSFIGRIIVAIAPYTLGVYLLHENIGVRYLWPEWMGSGKVCSVVTLVGYTLLAMICVFTAGIAVDFVRAKVFWGLDKGLMLIKPYRKLKEAVGSVDLIFSNKVK